MINKEFVRERLLLINSFLQELHDLASLDKDSFISQKRNAAAAESFLRRTLEAIFDIGRHILAKSGYMDLSTEYKSIAKGLGEIGIINKELSKNWHRWPDIELPRASLAFISFIISLATYFTFLA